MVKRFTPRKYPVSNPALALKNAKMNIRKGMDKDLIEKRLQFVVNTHWHSSKYGPKARKLQRIAKKSGLDVSKVFKSQKSMIRKKR